MNEPHPAIIIVLVLSMCFLCAFVGFQLGKENEKASAAKAGAGAYIIKSPEKSVGEWTYFTNSVNR